MPWLNGYINGYLYIYIYCSNACHQFKWGDHTLVLNSKHEKSDNKLQISLGNASAESFVAGVATVTKDTKFSYDDVVKIVKGNFIGFYAIVTETSDTNRIN